MLATLLLCAAFPVGGSVRIHADALVAGPTIELGEVAEIRVDSPEERERLSALCLGSTPAPTSVRGLTRDDVVRSLRAAGVQIAVGGAAECRARPRVEVVSGRDLENAARASLAALFAGRDVEIQVARPTADVAAIAAESRRELTAQPSRAEPTAGLWSVPVDVRADGSRLQTVWVALDVRLFERVPVAARELRQGDAFQADAWSLERVAVEASAPRSTQPALLQGATCTRDLKSGERIVATDVHREILVRAGDEVEIEVVRGLVRARRMAVARGQGADGDRIEVQSGENQRRLVGVVVARGLVRVELSESPEELPMKSLLFVPPASLVFVALLAGGASAQARRGSIYDLSHGSVSPVASKTAAKVGDLVTVVISETQDLKNEESSDISKSTALDYQIRNFDIAPNAFNPLPRLSASSDDEFNGEANYSKKGKFTARLTAVVVDVLPNGNLVIGGRRQIKIDKETKVLEFCGIVRGYDVKADNTVASEMVANARVSYEGHGPLTNGTNRRGVGGWVHDALDWLWPF